LDFEIKRYKRYGSLVTLIMMDIDDFKKYNDTYGHLEGDHLLRSLARILRYSLRETDFIARYGGDEFAVILPETGKDGARIVAERLLKNISQQSFGREMRRVTIGVGLSSYPADGVEKDFLLKKSDKSLYRAKGEGKNRVEYTE